MVWSSLEKRAPARSKELPRDSKGVVPADAALEPNDIRSVPVPLPSNSYRTIRRLTATKTGPISTTENITKRHRLPSPLASASTFN